jgi:UDP-2-acetamido-3-amino-2,3-dideoxy-glucuronate N-acetyltransferase
MTTDLTQKFAAVDPSASVHPTAIVEDGARIGARTRIWHRCHIREGSVIGDDCTLGFSVYVDAGAVIGNRCKIENHVSVYRGVVLEDEVFVGPSAAFTNDLYPRAMSTDWHLVETTVRRGASIGANATVVCGVELGRWSMVAAASVVTHDVPAHGLFVGSPARLRGWVCECGRMLGGPTEELGPRCGACGRDVPPVVAAP